MLGCTQGLPGPTNSIDVLLAALAGRVAGYSAGPGREPSAAQQVNA